MAPNLVVGTEAERVVLARSYYPRIRPHLTKERIIFTNGSTRPRVVVIGTYKKLARFLSEIEGVNEVILSPDSYTVSLRPGFDWEEVEPTVVLTIATHLELGQIDQLEYAQWRAKNSAQLATKVTKPTKKAPVRRKRKSTKAKVKPVKLVMTVAKTSKSKPKTASVRTAKTTATKKAATVKQAAASLKADGFEVAEAMQAFEPSKPAAKQDQVVIAKSMTISELAKQAKTRKSRSAGSSSGSSGNPVPMAAKARRGEVRF